MQYRQITRWRARAWLSKYESEVEKWTQYFCTTETCGWYYVGSGPPRRCKRKLRKKKKVRSTKKPFICDGPNWLFSLDGHDKMMGFQNSNFPLAIYACFDTFSRKIMFLHVWTGNSDPLVIGKFYMMYLNKAKIKPNYLRIDKGTETGVMASIHAYIKSKCGDMEDPTDAVIYGPSTSNKIEHWWRDLHECIEKGLKSYLNQLLSRCN